MIGRELVNAAIGSGVFLCSAADDHSLSVPDEKMSETSRIG